MVSGVEYLPACACVFVCVHTPGFSVALVMHVYELGFSAVSVKHNVLVALEAALLPYHNWG